MDVEEKQHSLVGSWMGWENGLELRQGLVLPPQRDEQVIMIEAADGVDAHGLCREPGRDDGHKAHGFEAGGDVEGDALAGEEVLHPPGGGDLEAGDDGDALLLAEQKLDVSEGRELLVARDGGEDVGGGVEDGGEGGEEGVERRLAGVAHESGHACFS
ncbi:unnamed protein product [Clonostachys chloroleuca]|uniref:Uncharacterized protein n=1 Tax=Clonostachys chloroleuca TaxID=1926264 RepID=A0AA35M4Q2_9HYPO|nr:unnamed protein product [Clonostachys chloroleuca]